MNPVKPSRTSQKKKKKILPMLIGEIAKRYFFLHQNLPSNQYALLAHWLQYTKNTAFGKQYNIASITSIQDFQKYIPVMHYEDMKPWIERCLREEENVLVPGKIERFATSSGTTGTSKYIPVTKKTLKNNHFKAGTTGLMHYVLENPDTKVFLGQNLAIGGGFHTNPFTGKENVGYISAILQKHSPLRAKIVKQPKADIAYILDWETKVEKTITATMKKNIVSISGQPSWCSQFLQRVIETADKKHITEVRPQFQLVMRGGMGIELYRDVFQKLLPHNHIQYYQVYNASEGFFAMQHKNNRDDMLLLLNHGIFYEFITTEKYVQKDYSEVYTIDDVKVGVDYVILITSQAGLWRYVLGDTIVFTGTKPHTIKITGRTKYYLDIVGECTPLGPLEKALFQAAEKLNIQIAEYCVGPSNLQQDNKRSYEVVLELHQNTTQDITKLTQEFSKTFDEALFETRGYYADERNDTHSLLEPIIHIVSSGTFYNWLEQKGKLGGQHKIPKISPTGGILQELLEITGD